MSSEELADSGQSEEAQRAKRTLLAWNRCATAQGWWSISGWWVWSMECDL